ncbi:MAG TPA: heterodisulfide reductase-related iron-sulfur binding cluster [Candidatus Limnocylindrales bacterium]
MTTDATIPGPPVRSVTSLNPDEPTMPEDGPTKTDFAYPAFYRTMIEREHLQVSRDESAWTERHTAPERPVDVLLNFGCNVRQTPHLMREAVAVFEALGVDFAAVAGQQFCCGKPYSNNGLHDAARQVVRSSVKRMASYAPRTAIQWCSACEMQFSDVVEPEVGIDFKSTGLASFLIRRLDALGSATPWQTSVPTKVLVHGHLGEHRVRDAHPPVAMDLLRRVPGVEVIGLAETPTLGLCDNAGPRLATIGTQEYLDAQSALEAYVADAGADAIVTLYHGCTRELGKFASERLAIRHYISIVAMALGISVPDRFSMLWRLGDPVKVAEASRPQWSSWGISEEEALQLAHKYFVPSYAVNAPECPCNGDCTRTGAKFLSAYRLEPPTDDVELIRPEDLV